MRIVAALLDVPDHQIDMLKAWSDDFNFIRPRNFKPCLPAIIALTSPELLLYFEFKELNNEPV